MNEAPYVPSAWGARFHSVVNKDGSQIKEILGGGAAGGGKSVALFWDPMAQIIVEDQRTKLDPSHPHWIPRGHSKGYALFLRRVSTMLGTAIDNSHRYFKQIDPKAEWNENEKEWRFSSGYRYRFGHCKDKNDWNRYWGDELTWVGFDEVTQFLLKQYEMISQRVRTDDPVLDPMTKIRCMGNPLFDAEGMDGVALDENPNWVRDRFIEPCREGNKVLKREVTLKDGSKQWWSWAYLPSRLSDNPNKAYAIRYETNLQTRKAHIRRALIDGDWYVVAGSYFADAWSDEVVVAPHSIPDEWPVFRSMDWGFKAPGCVHWWALDPDDNLICIYELVFQGQSATKVAQRIRDAEEVLKLGKVKEKRSRISGVADTQLWEERGQRGATMAEEMAAEGVLWVRADKKSRATNAQRMFERLQDRRGGIPALSFFRGRCNEILKLIPQIQTDPGDKNSPADGGYDHPFDSALYAVAYASRGKKGIPGRMKEKSQYDEDDDEPKVKTKQSWGYGR